MSAASTRAGAAAAPEDETRRAEAVAEGFRALYGRDPEGVWAAPGRVNLIGEYTDFNDGFVMPLALPHTAVAAVARREDGVLRVHSADVPSPVTELRVDELVPGRDTSWAAYPAGVVYALRTAGHAVGGADLHLASTVPTGAGLSSSAALEVVTALALNDLYELGLGRAGLARLAQRAENEFVGVPCGVMDQMAAACCTEGHALHLDTRDLSLRQVPFAPADDPRPARRRHPCAARAGRRGVRGAARGVRGGARRLGVSHLRDVPHAGLPAALERLADAGEHVVRYVRHIVTDNHRVGEVIGLLDAGDVRAVGPVLTEGHHSLRDDLRVSCAELDLVVESALDAGALGARMTGGGFGGSAVVLTEADAAERTGDAIRAAFAAAGQPEPRIFPALPSAGARRLS
ncbi:galactokinase [Streptomyces albidoflavus]